MVLDLFFLGNFKASVNAYMGHILMTGEVSRRKSYDTTMFLTENFYITALLMNRRFLLFIS